MDTHPLHTGATPPLPAWDRFAPWMPLLFALIAFLCWGGRPLWDTSEARYGQAAFEMMTTHDWLTPSLGGVPHLTKPPLSYWLIASGMKLFGVNAWGARFFLSVSFLLTIFAVQSLGRAMGFEPRKAAAAALVYATAVIPFGGGHTLTTDGFLVLWETVGVLAAWQVWRGARNRQPLWRMIWRMIFWAAFGLAFLTKGPPGCLPLLVIPVFLRLRQGEPLPRLFSPAGLALFLFVSLSWFGLMIWRQPGLLDYFLQDELIQRVFTTGHHRNAPFWIYAPVLVIGMAPWLPLWPWMIKRVWGFRPGQNKRLNDWQLFLVLWTIIPLIIFTIAKSRLVFYVLPLFVPLALGFGHLLIDELLPRLSGCAGWQRAAKVTAMLWMLLMLIYTNDMGLIFPDRSLHQAAAAFDQAAAKAAPGSQLYWLWAGRQQYSLAFSMRRIIKETETIIPRNALKKNSPQPLYITEEQTLTAASADGRLAPFVRPMVLIRAQGYALFAMPQGEDK